MEQTPNTARSIETLPQFDFRMAMQVAQYPFDREQEVQLEYIGRLVHEAPLDSEIGIFVGPHVERDQRFRHGMEITEITRHDLARTRMVRVGDNGNGLSRLVISPYFIGDAGLGREPVRLHRTAQETLTPTGVVTFVEGEDSHDVSPDHFLKLEESALLASIHGSQRFRGRREYGGLLNFVRAAVKIFENEEKSERETRAKLGIAA